MATQDRPELAHRAAHLFLEQDYPGPKRLVIFDDGDRSIVPCRALAAVEIVRHARIALPVKRNRMMRRETDLDAIYVLWDDDDYHGPDRIRHQVIALQANSTAGGCTLRPFVYFNQITDEVRLCIGHIADATVAFRRHFWEDRPWDETIDPGSGHRWVRKRSDLIAIDGLDDYIVVWHGHHRFAGPPSTRDEKWRDSAIRSEKIRALLATQSACCQEFEGS